MYYQMNGEVFDLMADIKTQKAKPKPRFLINKT